MARPNTPYPHRELLAEQVYNGYAIQANGTQPVLSVAYRPDAINTVYDFNVDTANQLMEEAGWEQPVKV